MNKEFSPPKARRYLRSRRSLAKDGTGNEAAKTLHRIDKALVIKKSRVQVSTRQRRTMRANRGHARLQHFKERNKDDVCLAFPCRVGWSCCRNSLWSRVRQ
jgi:hypothetical protein